MAINAWKGEFEKLLKMAPEHVNQKFYMYPMLKQDIQNGLFQLRKKAQETKDDRLLEEVQTVENQYKVLLDKVQQYELKVREQYLKERQEEIAKDDVKYGYNPETKEYAKGPLYKPNFDFDSNVSNVEEQEKEQPVLSNLQKLKQWFFGKN